MSNIIVETKQLSKQYKQHRILNHVNLQLKKGKIYGLIGKNGAGKTTLMRMIAGLGFPTEGTIQLFGCEYADKNEMKEAAKRMGTMIEAPAIVGGMTAKENLHLQCLMKGLPNYEIEDEMLELTGLKQTGKKKAKNFSLGMKQRLGIAIALIGNPDFLMLDEPVNGLDPEGIVEIRNLIKQLQEHENKTILLSSHNLPELYQTATDYIFIHEGEIKEVISHEELEEQCRCYLLLESTDVNFLTTVLERKLHATDFKVMPDNSVRLYDLLDERERVAKTLQENGVVLTGLSVNEANLEDYFLKVIGGK